MRLSKEQIQRARKNAARVTRQKRGGSSKASVALSERRFAERRKQDAAKAMMLGLSAEFICNKIPAYVRGYGHG